MSIRTPAYLITYEGVDITADVQQHLEKLSFSDVVESESPDLSLTFEDVDGLWKTSWYPETGAKVRVELGYEDDLFEVGTFDIDELEMSGPPDIFVLKALATGIAQSLRTRKSRSHENKTLEEIAQAVADENELTLQGDIERIQIERVTQNRQTDLAFLKSLGEEFGYVFTIRDDQLVFYNQIELEQADPVSVIDRTDMISYSLTEKTTEVYAEAELQYTNPELKEVVRGLQREGFDVTRPDKLELFMDADNVGQAEKKAQVALYRANSEQASGIIELQGWIGILAGVNIELHGLGVASGVYHIKKATHEISRSTGYKTKLDVKKVSDIADEFQSSRTIDIPVR